MKLEILIHDYLMVDILDESIQWKEFGECVYFL